MRQDTGNLKSLHGGGAQVGGVFVIEQKGDAEFEGVGDEAKVLVVEASGPTDAESVPEPVAPRFLRGAVKFGNYVG